GHVGAVGAATVAALPLVGEGRGRVAGPAARAGGQRLPLHRRAADRRRRRIGGRAVGRGHDGRRAGGDRAAGAGAVAGGDLDEQAGADVAGGEQIGRACCAGHVGAVGAATVAALPLVGEGRGRVAGPAARAGGQRLP